MKRKVNFNGGYVGLLMLFISVSLIVFFIVRTDLFKGKTLNPETGEMEKDDRNIIEGGFDAINQTKDLKAKLEYNAQPIPE